MTVNVVIITGVTWLALTILTRFVLPDNIRIAVMMIGGVITMIVPFLSHVGIFIAIRRQNRLVQSFVSGQDACVIFRREKKVAIDMIIVTVVLLLCVAPGGAVSFFHEYGQQLGILYVWLNALIFVNSSINPIIYLVRRRDIRNALRSMVPC